MSKQKLIKCPKCNKYGGKYGYNAPFNTYSVVCLECGFRGKTIRQIHKKKAVSLFRLGVEEPSVKEKAVR